ISGQTSNVLIIPSVTAADAGTYTVQVATPCGTNSSSATLTIDSRPQILSLTRTGLNVTVSFTTTSGKYYRLQFTDDMGTGLWATAVDNILGTGGTMQATDVGGAGRSHRFYRLKLLTDSDLIPAAAFTASPTSGQAPLLVTFTDASTGLITN